MGCRKPGTEISGVISREKEGRGLLLNYQRRTRSVITETAGGRGGGWGDGKASNLITIFHLSGLSSLIMDNQAYDHDLSVMNNNSARKKELEV